jgi:hypothetical protein
MDQATARDQANARPDTEGAVAMRRREGGDLAPDPAIVDPAEHNVVFTSLVTADDDIVGLVAYSIYKQNKYDWLQAYSRLEGRMPEPAEVHSYLLGESTTRRLATYRHLAQAVLEGRGAEVAGSAAARLANRAGTEADRVAPVRTAGPAAPRIGLAQGRSNFQLSARAIVALCIALVVLVALFLLLRSGAPLPPATPAR